MQPPEQELGLTLPEPGDEQDQWRYPETTAELYDLWDQLQDAYFKELFVNPIEKNQDAEKKALLSKLIKPFILRRKKSEVLLELPEKIEEIAYCDLSDEQREL